MNRLPRRYASRNDSKGFSLIELVVVISVLAVMMVTVTSVMVNAFRARSRVDIADKLEQNGNLALNEIKNDILRSNGSNVSCAMQGSGDVGTSISYINREDGQQTTINCLEGIKIASSSANPADLTSNDVIVQGCDTFVSCDTLPSSISTVSVVNFKFVVATSTMPSVGIAETISRSFETKVVIR
jgi:prepilin-type N-terminal cleavage/methylation domain-containing protein